MSKNKVKYGLRNVYYAPLTMISGKAVYGTPIAHPGAVSITLQAEGDSTEFEADDSVYFEETSNNGYSGDLEFALISDDFKREIMGETIDANGAMVENSEAKFKPFALMFEFNGDQKATRHVLYNCKASRTEIASKTKGKSIDPTPEKLPITVRPAEDTRDVKAKIMQGQPAYETFFSAVYLKNAVINTTASTALSFSKATPEDITVDSTSTSTNSITNVRIDGALIPGIFLTVTGIDVAIDNSYLTGLDFGTYVITVEFEKGNAVSISLTIGI